MKKNLVLVIIEVVLFTGCSLVSMIIPFVTGVVTFEHMYDLDNNERVPLDGGDYSKADLILEPWYKNGEPAPGLQLYSWGDNATFIHDLGEISLSNAFTLNDEEIEPDSIVWEVYVEEKHTYYVMTSELNEYFVYISGVEIEEYENSYDCEVYFDFKLK